MIRILTSLLMVVASSGCGAMLASKSPDDLGGWGFSKGGVRYALPKALLPFKLSEKGGHLAVTIEAPTYVADEEKSFVLRYAPSPLASDTFDVTIDPKTGLLTRIDMTADDKVDEIIVEIAKAIAIMESATDEQETVLLQRLIDPADPKRVTALALEMNTIRLARFPKEPEIKIDITPPNLVAGPGPDCSVGVCYRLGSPYIVGFSFANGVAYETKVDLPNGMPVTSFALDRTLAVTKVDTLEFESGMLKHVHVDKPSEGLELAQLPIEIAKAILSAPAEIVQLKVALSDQERALAEKRVALIDAEKTLREKSGASARGESSVAGAPLLSGTSAGRSRIATRLRNPQPAQPEIGAPLDGVEVDLGSNGRLGVRP